MKKIKSASELLCLGLISFLFCCCAVNSTGFVSVARATESAQKSETIERDYLVKGMTCAGCVFGVKKALERAGVSRSEIVAVEFDKPDPANSVGHAKVRFSNGKYNGKDTDCKIAKEVFSNPGYKVYWDKAEQNPCKL